MSSRILNFADGFTSATAPTSGGGATQEEYAILNNTLGGTLFTTDKTMIRSVFINYELMRKNNDGTFVQTGQMTLQYDGTAWNFSLGNFKTNYQGGEYSMLRSDAIESVEEVQLLIDPVSGALTYNSGNMNSLSYDGTFILDITRIVA